jgi:hypothetical protein
MIPILLLSALLGSACVEFSSPNHSFSSRSKAVVQHRGQQEQKQAVHLLFEDQLRESMEAAYLPPRDVLALVRLSLPGRSVPPRAGARQHVYLLTRLPRMMCRPGPARERQ